MGFVYQICSILADSHTKMPKPPGLRKKTVSETRPAPVFVTVERAETHAQEQTIAPNCQPTAKEARAELLAQAHPQGTHSPEIPQAGADKAAAKTGREYKADSTRSNEALFQIE